MRKLVLAAAAATTIASPFAAAAVTSAASAAPAVQTATLMSANQPVQMQHLTGSVALNNPPQFETFNNIGGPNGSVSYTNFTYADPGSGVWSLNGAEIDFGYQGVNYPHQLTVDSITPTGQNSFTFTGHGVFTPDTSYTWTATGSVSGNQLSMHILYTGAQAGYWLNFTGTINPDGSVTGTSFNDSLGRTLTVSMPAGSLFEALSYTAPVSNVSFPTPNSAQFSFVIPAGHALAGTPVTVNVTDGGNPGINHDLYAHNGVSYPVIGGNLTVH